MRALKLRFNGSCLTIASYPREVGPIHDVIAQLSHIDKTIAGLIAVVQTFFLCINKTSQLSLPYCNSSVVVIVIK